ncbi:putative heterokaryon incompatibility protein [Botrytis fragariae]|uniref:Putative heterokaryon incompatibility protein n=1 Tax=Botrytis fragariae TaxID=1964551 RepID=A0A8H6AXP4_9HELO|nr:putative heterokaryon incompatibility protein [Botrytis fragariae]KAF5875696.1 putative heterokaryon incompatibility protein [Botrytis fragariae]
MKQRCTYCSNLSLSHLIDLAKIDFKGHVFPNQPTTEDSMGPFVWTSSLANPDKSPRERKPMAFYPHHKCFQDLVKSAEIGCDLCEVILTCLKKRIPGEDEDSRGGNADEIYWTDFSRRRETDIKISINSSHVYPDATLDEVQMLDTILVQVGNIGDLRSDFKTRGRSFEVLTQSLTIITKRNSPIRLKDFQIGRAEIDPDLGSKLNYDITRGWLKECLECHSCHNTNLPQLPTRVIDVTPNQTRIIHSNGIKAHYIALSHCWGGPIPTSSTTVTLPQYQNELPFEPLPANFRDAITITRELGVQYLWIDSLCIIQDSKHDWEQESQKMGTVYRDALVTVYAMSSEASTGGIIPNPACQPVEKPSTTLALTDDNGMEVTVRVEPADRDIYDEDLHRLAESSPLSSRGWTFQESILSPRHIYYGKKQIYWGCTQGFHDLKGMPSGYRFSQEEHINRLLPVLHSTIPDTNMITDMERLILLRSFRDMVWQYCQRDLTYDTDKLPAISGLSRLLQPAIGGDYLAGLWSCDMLDELCWVPEMKSGCFHVKPYRAPSWSWAVTNNRVQFRRDTIIAPKDRIAELKIIDYKVVPKVENNPYGEIESAYLIVEGLTLPVLRAWQTRHLGNYDYDGFSGIYCFDDPAGISHYEDSEPSENYGWLQAFRKKNEGKGEQIMTGWENRSRSKRVIDVEEEKWMKEEYIVLLVSSTNRDDGDERPYAECLILKKVDRNEHGDDDTIDVYERVGNYVVHHEPEWLESWTMKTVKLI